jgi:hypothetical protein
MIDSEQRTIAALIAAIDRRGGEEQQPTLIRRWIPVIGEMLVS